MANKLALVFEILAKNKASSEIDHVGDSAKRTGDKVEHSSGRAGKAFGLLGKTFATSSAGALGPLQELTDKMEVFSKATEEGGSKTGGRLLGVGLAATAAGSFLESLHSREQSALQQLQASIATTGHSYEDYAEEVEKAVSSGEHFGNQASTTVDALNRLVTTTHNPEQAFKGLSVAIDVAAEKHIPLAKAAEIVGLTFNGSQRAGKQFGLQLENVTGATTALQTAQKASVAATTAAKNAQTTYTEKLDLWNNSSSKTRSQAYALRDAHDKLVDAQAKAAAAAERVKSAQEKASEAHEAGARNVQKLADVVAGQGNAAAETFTGRLKAMGAEIEDTLGANGKLGGTLVTVGVVTSGIGALASAGLFSGIGKLIGRLGLTGGAFKTLRDVEVTTSAEGAAAVEASAVKVDAALASEAAAAEATGTKVGLSAAGMVGRLGVIGGVLAGISYAADKVAHKLFKDLGSDAIPDDVFKAAFNGDQTVIDRYLNQPGLDYAAGQSDATAATRKGRDAQSDNPNVAARAQGVVASVLATTKPKAKKAGADTGDSFLNGLLSQLSGQDAAAATNKAAQNAAQLLVDAAQKAFSNAQSRLQSLVSDALSLRQSVTSALQGGSALTDIFQGPDLNANGAFGKQNNFGRVRDFLQRRVAQERKFVLELRQLIKQGLDPSLVAQIASAGVDGGGRVAEAILSGGQSGIGQVNGLERQIASLANTTGKTVADQHYARQIAEQRHTTEVLGHKLDVANSHLAQIQNGAGGSSAAASLRSNAALAGV